MRTPAARHAGLFAVALTVVMWGSACEEVAQRTADGGAPSATSTRVAPVSLATLAKRIREAAPPPARDPLNLIDLELPGATDPTTVGHIGTRPVSIAALEKHSVKAFTRICKRLFAARDRGYQWRVERQALSRLAAQARLPRLAFLQRQFARMPAPTPQELEAILASNRLDHLPEGEQQHAARSLWRIRRWLETRAGLVLRGLQGMTHSRQYPTPRTPADGSPKVTVWRVGGTAIPRRERRRLAGFQAELARNEYYRIAKLQFPMYVREQLRLREAKRLGLDVPGLLAREVKRQPAVTVAAVNAFLKREPAYQKHPKGRARARGVLERLRSIAADKALDARLRQATTVTFQLTEPSVGGFRIDVPSPRFIGPKQAAHELVVYHGLACRNCQRGSTLLLRIVSHFGKRLHVRAGDYFTRGRLASYRGALALRCAPTPAQQQALFEALVASFGTGEIGALVKTAQGVGIPATPYRACLEADRYLPAIVEDVLVAERLGLERNIPGLFANGVRIGKLRSLKAVIQQIQKAFGEAR